MRRHASEHHEQLQVASYRVEADYRLAPRPERVRRGVRLAQLQPVVVHVAAGVLRQFWVLAQAAVLYRAKETEGVVCRGRAMPLSDAAWRARPSIPPGSASGRSSQSDRYCSQL